MSSDVAIRVEGLGKAYSIRHQRSDHVTLAQVALERAKHPFQRDEREQVWALRHASFEVRKGEVLGVIGRNGAGKSTLLKLLTRVTGPTEGRIDLWGRVGSLLEVGTGFHPELTGRENVYLNGSILGMARKEIDRQFDAIVEFAGVEKFLDTPVKRYSSGMYVRLAFAVAAHLETEILLLDEVLAVGDGDFQAKCLGKVSDLARSGRSIVLVSHNMGSISAFAERSLLLENGSLVAVGDTATVIERYTERLGSHRDEVDVEHSRRPDPALGESVRLLRVALDHSNGIVGADEDLRIRVVVRAMEEVGALRVGQSIKTPDGSTVGTSFSAESIYLVPGVDTELDVTIPRLSLAPGNYHLAVSIGFGDESSSVRDLDAVYDTVHFEVAPEINDDGAVATWNRGWGATRFQPPQVLAPSRVNRS